MSSPHSLKPTSSSYSLSSKGSVNIQNSIRSGVPNILSHEPMEYISSSRYNTTPGGTQILKYKGLTFSQRSKKFHGKGKLDILELELVQNCKDFMWIRGG